MTRLSSILPLTVGLAVGLCPVGTWATEAAPREPDREALLALPWKEFDQTPGSGWRWYQSQTPMRYLEAARLIEAYLARHDDLLPRQRALCHFHAAHNFLFRFTRTGAGEPREAIPHLDQAIVPDGATPPSADWNDLVRATKAFLLQDRATLLAVKARIAALPRERVKFLQPPNSPDDLVEHFGQPYGAWFPQTETKK